MSRSTVCISTIERPHIEGPECWCKPHLIECTCGHGCGPVLGHSFVEFRPDTQERMAVFSEQIAFRTPSWGR